MGLTGLACEVNDLSRQQQEPPLIGNPRFLKRGGCQIMGLADTLGLQDRLSA